MSAPVRHVFLIAGEESGDRLGAALMRSLRRVAPDMRFSGVGGAQMEAEGMVSMFPLGELAIVGFASVPLSLRKILHRIAQTADAAVAARPDVLVIIDSPEFTHRVARKVRARMTDLRIVDYVCPSVWAWRPGRARAMRAYVDHVLALLPFEPDVVRRLGGPPCTYVGHPLSEQVAVLRPDADEARRRLAAPPVLLVLPGSRATEINRMATIFGEAVQIVRDTIGALDVVVPAVQRLAPRVEAQVKAWRVPARIVVDAAEKNAAFRVARAALTKSGTSTLELALAGVPMVAAYKVSLVEELVGRMLINVPSIILANLVLGENIVPERLQRQCTPAELARLLIPLLSQTEERQRQVDAFRRFDSIMQIGKAIPSERAAAVVMGVTAGEDGDLRETVALPPRTA